MSKKKFNPKDWTTPATVPTAPIVPNNNPKNDIETITQRIETTTTDIAPNYPDWRDLGFALADALGESGRNYYHRLSCFYPKYNQTETNKQYNNCLKSHGHGVTIKTLYHLAKSAGIDVSIKIPPVPKQAKSSKSPNPHNGDIEDFGDIGENSLPCGEGWGGAIPTIPQEVYNNLPNLLQQIISKADSPEDADLLLLGSITVFSSCLPNIYGLYNQCEVYPNLFLFVVAKASAGKGRLSLCRRLVAPIHRHLREM